MLFALVTQVDIMLWNWLISLVVLTKLVLQVDLVFGKGYADCEIRALLGMVDMKSSQRITNKDFLKSSPNNLELRLQ